ncbi:MAG: 16S rRNA (cytosine(967)-C(5))-methyltransferase RsmB [Syntrophus sp. (in: bacteria)]|nr:16S rRNA (cytosine(967)-C(5))-methyltransferase RsmB [Syntrophus sp. (in: bacteria)]
MKDSARSLAVDILNRIDQAGLFAEPLLDQALSRGALTDIHDRRLLTEIVYGTLRMRGRIDWVIARFYKGDPESMDSGVRNCLRTALYQFFFTDRIPAFAIVDEAVKLVKAIHPTASGLVNAILRNVMRREKEIPWPQIEADPAVHISVVHSHPLWLVKRWIALFGVQETLGLCKANNEIPPLSIRVNRLKATREEVMRRLEQDGFNVRETQFSPDGLVLMHAATPVRDTFSYKNGQIQVQDEASQLAGFLLDPRPGEKILDACAGAGVKASYLAEIMQNHGSVTAVDISRQKVKALRENTERLGIAIIAPLVMDLREDPGEAFRGVFDGILLDVPCSGLGTLRRNPEIKWRITSQDIRRHADLQKRLLDGVAGCLRPGGRLVYCTCSVMSGENEDVIADFLSRHGDFRRIRPPDIIPLSMVTDEGFFKARTDCHGTDGFFGAVLQRVNLYENIPSQDRRPHP